MTRRLLLLAAIALGSPAWALAQPKAKIARVAIVFVGERTGDQPYTSAFVGALAALGHVEGRNLELTFRYAGGNTAMVPKLLADAVSERPDVIVTAGAAAALQAKAATSTIPVVVATASDLVQAGVVQSYARPGGNITGLSDLIDEGTAKRVELAREMVPGASRIGLLLDPSFPATKRMEARGREVAKAQGFELAPLYATTREELTALSRQIVEKRIDVLVVGGSALHTNFARLIIDAGTGNRVPVIHYWPGTAEGGALASHGPNVLENFRRAAGYVDKILKGAKPADLPVEQSTTFELVINLRAARALGIKIPSSILVRADRVIE